MRPPPPLSWCCTGSIAWRSLRAALAGLAAASATAWALGQAGSAPSWVLLGALGGAGVGLAFSWRLAVDPRGVLAWDGRSWSWQAEAGVDVVPVRVAIAFDLQVLILLRLQTVPASRALWLAVGRRQDPANWRRFCACLVATGPAQAA